MKQSLLFMPGIFREVRGDFTQIYEDFTGNAVSIRKRYFLSGNLDGLHVGEGDGR